MKIMTKATLTAAIRQLPARSKWAQGVKDYAEMLLDNINNFDAPITEKKLLDGASDWHHYSWAGCALCYNHQICAKLATPSEQKRTRNGALKPNLREEWLDTQARALFQASQLILNLVNEE